MKFSRRAKSILIGLALLGIWCAAHVPAIGLFAHVPFVSAVIGDEPSPMYGALAILNEKSPLGLRNLPQLYYGPVFAAMAVPAIVFDAATSFIVDGVRTPDAYRSLLIRDMAGPLVAMRWITVLVGFLALYGAYCLFKLSRFNPDKQAWWPWFMVLAIAIDPFFFKYSHFYRHWVFIIAVLIWNIVFATRLADKPEDKKAWLGLWVTNIFGFGISFISLLYQAALLPAVWNWLRKKNKKTLSYFAGYCAALIAGVAAIVAWNPFPYLRLVRMGTESGTGHTLHFDFPSLLSYASYLFNNYAFVIVLVIGLSVAGWTVARERMKAWWGIAILPALSHLAFFAASETNPPRYLMPIFITLWIVLIGCLASLWPWLTKKRFEKPVLVLVLVTVVISGLQSARWSWLASQPQPEERLIETLRETSARSSVLYVGRLLPAWHDPSSYKNYAEACLNYEADLFKDMAAMSPLDGIDPLYMEYWCFEGEVSRDVEGYATDIIKPEGESLESNVLEANWWRHWDMERWGLRFRVLKGNLTL